MLNKTIKIIFFGDIVGSLGRTAVKKIAPIWQKKYQTDLMIANVENLAHGKGITLRTLQDISKTDIKIFTGGNHIWAKDDIEEINSVQKFPIAFPANDPRTLNKYSTQSITIKNQKITTISLLGRTFLQNDTLKNPFKKAIEIIKQFENDIIILDFHAEATSEKRALGFYLDGKISALLGTHTHVPTNDAQILPLGTGYITDVGMVGSYDSVLGVDKSVIIEKFINENQVAHKYPDSGQIELNAVLLEIDKDSKKTITIQNLRKILY